jgi:hypothetical protein
MNYSADREVDASKSENSSSGLFGIGFLGIARQARTAPAGFQAPEFQTVLQSVDFLMEFLDGDAVVLCKGAEFTNFGVMAGHKTFRLTDTQNAGVNLACENIPDRRDWNHRRTLLT